MSTAPTIQFRPVADLAPSPTNARTHSPAQIDQIAASIKEFGFVGAILADADGIVAGHGRAMAATLIYADDAVISLPSGDVLPKGMVPVLDCTGWSPAQRKAYMIADNSIALAAGWNEEVLAAEIAALTEMDFDLDLLGFDEKAVARMLGGIDEQAGSTGKGNLAEEFMIPPFSVLSAREGWWQDRKRAWLALGIDSEVGRGENLLRMSDTMLEPDPEKRAKMQNGKRKAATFGQDSMRGEHVVGEAARKATPGVPSGSPLSAYTVSETTSSGTSIFDPVVCELAYRWFSPVGGVLLDPFAGGSVRGIVAAKLGRNYVGIDLRAEQVEANRAQAATICDDLQPQWHVGDSAALIPDLDVAADFVFSCPPYGDLEVYSDDPADLSTMADDAFLEIYRDIIAKAVAKLKQDRFACFVVGDYRDKKGFYRDFVSRTIRAFEDAGARLYNEAILVTATGSLAIRAGKQFRTTRKLGKTHQNILVFCKGDPKKATAACGPVDVTEALKIAEAESVPNFGEEL